MIVAEPPRRITSPDVRFTAAEFMRMIDAGVFETTRVELMNGRIRWMGQNDPHMFGVTRGAKSLLGAARAMDWVAINGTLRLDLLGIDDSSTPDPDLMWFDTPEGTPVVERGLPMLLVEVSDSTYSDDVGEKLRKYAQAGIADYWVENINADRVEVHRDPVNDAGEPDGWRYATVTHHIRGERIALLKRPEASLAVDDLLPARRP